ncbi:transcription factor PHYTOCHROME INTERACTING FACTOR-LIKE 13-like [Hordeum vulgare subsp. vulgare]|uniref:Predicted protein n=3 Tax=Hordeum vulgare subsp. vulgare TaxID=112509 RepID=F2DE45_HORVV|nr:transcription factor PHYTOCHROME INTERACTING FACTOR-LIKE 13-like [Hordeum vulgare subsp. vulgare]XP_044984656.1 transcription factor PHYTOCHROME INTERACTING FACTOR-LIKE 13-like [Hordeum vulgare subsp. vulgare]KAI4984722.1 hypothetical protein ZWY2020_017352 [Hordeum vulgare]BAJ93366.1 predicted protein [Hordeum vulgare subsp. vulgare]
MSQFVPDWGNMGDISRPLGEDDDLMELLWCNGNVVMQSQGHRKLPPRPEKVPAPAVVQEDEAGLWFPFALADSLDKDIFTDLFCEEPPGAAVVDGAGKAGRGDGAPLLGDVDGRSSQSSAVSAASDLMPPPKSTHTHVSCSSRQQSMSLADCGDNAGGVVSGLVQARAGKAAMEEGASSTLSAIGASFCGSNQVQVQGAVSEQGRAGHTTVYGGRGAGSALPSAVGSGNANASGRGHEATVASSSGRSNYCFGAAATTTTTTTGTEPTSTSNRSSKRKRGLDTEDSESPSEDAESESLALDRKPPQKLTTARRSRAAEVHNLSERRRRDRINEKMRALQELIPHCNKTDKASMLDEAIEYLKTLQMQVQMMWMGGGMAAPPAVMFPGMHQYLPQMGPASMARMPFMAPQQQGSLPEQYAHFLGVNHHHLQPPAHHHHHQHFAQGVGYYPLGPKALQQSPALHHVPNGSGTPAATANTAPGNAIHPNKR